MRQEISHFKTDRPGIWSIACLIDARKVIRFMGFQVGMGTIAWDGREDGGNKLPSGTYFTQIDAGVRKETMNLVRLE